MRTGSRISIVSWLPVRSSRCTVILSRGTCIIYQLHTFSNLMSYCMFSVRGKCNAVLTATDFAKSAIANLPESAPEISNLIHIKP